MRSLTKCVRANPLMTWIRVSFHKLPIRLEYQHSISSRKYTYLYRSVDLYLRLRRPYREKIIFCGDTAPAYGAITTILYEGCHCFSQFHRKKTKLGKDTILVSMNVSSLYTNILQEEGTNILCEAYEKLNDHNAPIPTHYLKEMLGLIFQENLFQFNEENFSQTKMGGVICQYFHGENWNEINPTKRNQAKRMETLHWWLSFGLRQRRSR